MVMLMDNYDLTVHIVEIVVKEMGRPFHYDSEFDLYWDELRNPILNLLEEERPGYNQHMGECSNDGELGQTVNLVPLAE